VGPARLFDSQCERWSLVIPLWFTCVVLSGYFPCKVTIDEGCQWEIQTEEGWVPYWDSQV
jgi:hypothetical protein